VTLKDLFRAALSAFPRSRWCWRMRDLPPFPGDPRHRDVVLAINAFVVRRNGASLPAFHAAEWRSSVQRRRTIRRTATLRRQPTSSLAVIVSLDAEAERCWHYFGISS